MWGPHGPLSWQPPDTTAHLASVAEPLQVRVVCLLSVCRSLSALWSDVCLHSAYELASVVRVLFLSVFCMLACFEDQFLVLSAFCMQAAFEAGSPSNMLSACQLPFR